MNKITENDDAVQYKITIDIPAGNVFDARGRARTKYKEIYAYVTLNKRDESFVLDAHKSDPFFVIENPRELTAVRARLIGIKRAQEIYKDLIVIATC